MLIEIFVDALASQLPPLDLNLSCDGQYEDVETSVGTASGVIGGELRSTTSVVNTPVKRAGVAHLTFQGETGQLTYPDGRVRTLANVIADSRHVSADYQRKQLFRTITWKIEVNRMTGGLRVLSGNDIAFAGTCAPESTLPKF